VRAAAPSRAARCSRARHRGRFAPCNQPRRELLKIGETLIDDTCRSLRYALYAAGDLGYDPTGWTPPCTKSQLQCSVIACDAEAGRERWLGPDEAPDGGWARRTPVRLLRGRLAKSVANRTGQCLMTCPRRPSMMACRRRGAISLGKHIRFFGDGYKEQVARRTPVLAHSGHGWEFLVEESVGVPRACGGTSFCRPSTKRRDWQRLAGARRWRRCRASSRRFRGIVRSGSKVGSRYKR